MQNTSQKFWSLSPEEVASILETDIKRGLSEEEASRRLKEYGRNKIEKPRQSKGFEIFLRQFTNPLIIILLLATVVTIMISHYRDAIFIFIAVLVNSLMGFYQENKAEKALSELESYLKQRSRVIRSGKEMEIDTEEITPGDMIRLSQGDRVPADARVVFVNDFQVDESILTGESLPTGKVLENSLANAGLGDQSSMVFAGTLVTQGTATALTCRTDNDTEFGKIASLIAETRHEETPLQKNIKKFSMQASIALGALTILVFIIGISSGYSVLEMFLTSVAIAVSAIPEGLPIAMTVILSVGVQRMAKRKGVIRKLIAAETLGGASVILTDKTGTLTMARMELTEIIPFGNMDEQSLLKRSLVNADVLIENPEADPSSWRMSGKIMETALVKGSKNHGIDVLEVMSNKKVLQSLPFNAVQKFSVSLIEDKGKKILIFFGAPDILLEHSTLSNEEKSGFHKHIDTLASEGKRVLGVAHREIHTDENISLSNNFKISKVSLDGLLTFQDPVRPQIKDTIERIGKAGIKTVIMTGDHRGTAEAIAREVGLKITEGSVIDATELSLMSDEKVLERLSKLSVIARVTPEDKLRIARLYQKAGETVAMTGDGVNDAPSIKQADVGIAMGSGTEVARAVADLVLLDDNFETIVAAVEEGRQIMGNIRKVLVYLLSNVTDGLILIGGSLIFGLSLPLNALQILWVNFFSDSFPAIAFAFEKEKNVLSLKPRISSKGLFDPLMKHLILTIGLTTSAMLFFIYWFLLNAGYDETLVRTFIFAAFGTYTLFVALSVRSLDQSIFSYKLFSNPYMTWGIAIGVVLMGMAIYVPFLQSIFDTVALPLLWLVAVIGIGVLNIMLIELGKWIFRIRLQTK